MSVLTTAKPIVYADSDGQPMTDKAVEALRALLKTHGVEPQA